jgi:antitoxin component of MazEF toxin-antitoxin module
MSEAEVEVRKWGNSLAVIVPAEVARAEELRPGDRALVRIMKVRHPDPRSFGFLRERRLDAQALKDRLRREHAW